MLGPSAQLYMCFKVILSYTFDYDRRKGHKKKDWDMDERINV